MLPMGTAPEPAPLPILTHWGGQNHPGGGSGCFWLWGEACRWAHSLWPCNGVGFSEPGLCICLLILLRGHRIVPYGRDPQGSPNPTLPTMLPGE